MTAAAIAQHALVDREPERASLEAALARLRDGRGGIVLLAGEAGVGKTRLAEAVLPAAGPLLLRGNAPELAPAPYGPVAAVLRALLRVDPHGLDECGPLKPYLAALLPELGAPPPDGDRATVAEAIHAALQAIVRRGPAVVFLDDLHWADATTLELLPALAARSADEPLLILGAYRSDEISRGHPLRRMRAGLRRAGRLDEIVVGCLGPAETAELAARTLGAAPAPSLARTPPRPDPGDPVLRRRALRGAGRRRTGRPERQRRRGLGRDEIPLPESIRDAVVARAQPLSPAARKVLEVASVAGPRFDLELVAELAGEAAIDEPLSLGIVVEVEPGVAAFRHTLTREALYLDVPWTRRRALHRRLAELLEQRGARPALVAEHWAAAREPARARRALLAAAEDFSAVHAYRDALESARRALKLWPADDAEGRCALLERIGRSAELCGELGVAALAWEEAAEARRTRDDPRSAAELDRRLAVVYELQGALGARARGPPACGRGVRPPRAWTPTRRQSCSPRCPTWMGWAASLRRSSSSRRRPSTPAAHTGAISSRARSGSKAASARSWASWRSAPRSPGRA